MHDLPACGRLAALLLLSACAAVKSGAGGAYDALLPDEVYVEASESPFRAGADETLYTAGLSWALAPREVVVVEERANAWDVTEKAWFETLTSDQPAQAAVAPLDGLSISSDPEGGWTANVPMTVLVAILAALGLGGGAVVRRRMSKPEPEEHDG